VEDAVSDLLEQQPHWSGTASQLFDLLSPLASCCSPKVLSEQLRDDAPAFAAAHITVKFRRAHEGVRVIDLSRKSGDALYQISPSESSPLQPTEKDDLLAAWK
jgi:hypothetical protein